MLIRHRQSGQRGLFFVGNEGVIEAELVYHLNSEGNMVIEHTEVGEALAGKGVAKQLVETAVDYARKQRIKIIPICPFAKSLFDITPEWNDLLA